VLHDKFAALEGFRSFLEVSRGGVVKMGDWICQQAVTWWPLMLAPFAASACW